MASNKIRNAIKINTKKLYICKWIAEKYKYAY